MLYIPYLIISLFLGRQPVQPAIQAKLVYKSCASVIVQITDSSYFYLTQEKWQRSPNDPVYDHVFTVRNSCSFLDQQIDKGDFFSFRVIKNETGNTGCVQCLLYDNPPGASLSIEVVK